MWNSTLGRVGDSQKWRLVFWWQVSKAIIVHNGEGRPRTLRSK